MNIIDGGFSVAQIANFAVALAFVASAFLAVLFILKGGISFITSGGDEEKVKEAVHTIRYAIIGIVWIVISVFLVKVIGAAFGINFLSYLTFDKIKEMYEMIVATIQSNNGSPDYIQGVLD